MCLDCVDSVFFFLVCLDVFIYHIDVRNCEGGKKGNERGNLRGLVGLGKKKR